MGPLQLIGASPVLTKPVNALQLSLMFLNNRPPRCRGDFQNARGGMSEGSRSEGGSGESPSASPGGTTRAGAAVGAFFRRALPFRTTRAQVLSPSDMESLSSS